MNAMQSPGAVAYIRKSVAGRSEFDRSRDNQTHAVAALAERDGATLVRVYDGDWGVSATREKRTKRRAMTELIADIRAGTVTALYAYALDRLARDTEHALALWNACREAGVPIITDQARFDTADSNHRFHYVILSEQAAGEIDRITKRNRDVKARAKVNGTATGGPPVYGTLPGETPVATIIEAYRTTGSFTRAAKSLTDAGIKPRRGAVWSHQSVQKIVGRAVEQGAVEDLNVPDVHDRRARVSPSRTHVFSGLLACHCGQHLTAIVRSRRHVDGSPGTTNVGYLCRRGSFDPKHSRPIMISEPTAIAWARAQIEVKHGLRHPIAHPDSGYDPVKAARIEKERAATYAQLLSPDNKVPEHVSNKALAALDERERVNKAQGRAHLVLRRSVNWSAAAADINADLRAILTRIDLDTAMRPISADWVIDPGPRSPLLDGPPLGLGKEGWPL